MTGTAVAPYSEFHAFEVTSERRERKFASVSFFASVVLEVRLDASSPGGVEIRGSALTEFVDLLPGESIILMGSEPRAKLLRRAPRAHGAWRFLGAPGAGGLLGAGLGVLG
ncbi:MAG: hypothetical protein ACFB2Z_11660 [Maricaulaceae bacterium]